jgi:O-antigen/teichoic acid export membrane protein
MIALIGQIVTIGATFGSRIYLVQKLPIAQYGEIMLGVAMASILSPIATIGIPYAMARQLAHAKNASERRNLVIAAVELAIPLAILAGIALYLAAPYLSNWLGGADMTEVLRFFSAFLAFGIFSGVLGSLFQGDEDMLPTTLFNGILSPVLFLVAIIILFSTGASLSAALFAYIISSAIALAGLALYTARARARFIGSSQGDLLPKQEEGHTIRNLLLFSIPLTMMGVASVVTGNVDSLLLGYFKQSTSLVGTYSALLTMSRLLLLGVAAFSAIMIPVAARLHKNHDLKELGRSYATMTKWILCIFIPLYLIFMILPSPTLLFVYRWETGNATYASAPMVLRIVATGTMLTCIFGPATSVLIGLGKVRLLFYDTLASAIIDVLGSLLLIPFLGIYGAAIAFALATASLPFLAVIQTSMLSSVHPFTSTTLKPFAIFVIAAGLLLGLPVYFLNWTPGWIVVIAMFFVLVLLYVAIILGTRSMETEDLHLLGVVERYLGRPLPPIRRVILHFRKNQLSDAKDL